MSASANPSLQASAEKLSAWRKDPVRFVRDVFHVEPDAWQVDALSYYATSNRIAMKACKGPGKTALLAWCIWHFLVCYPHPKIAATSITGDNLQDGLWTELAKWQKRSPLLSDAFEWQKQRIVYKGSPETWWASARTWPKSGSLQQQADTLAGLHADYLLFLIDEAGGVPDAVMAAAEAGLATGIVTKIIIAGNPTHLEGPLYRAATKEKHLWKVVSITGDPDDPKRSPRISVQWAREQIDKYGRDNPWVKVNVFGEFPPSSLNALIGAEEVEEAMKRAPRPEHYSAAAMLLGVDVGREGDDPSIIFPRQGIATFMPVHLRNVDGQQGSSRLLTERNARQADAIFIDSTGGFASSWIDFGRLLKLDLVPIHFNAKPSAPQGEAAQRYLNKRAEMWWLMVEWVRAGGALPPIPELVAELSTPTYSFTGDKIQIEDKAQVKLRLGRSPNYADALALTFAHPIQARAREDDIPSWARRHANQVQWDYDPYAEPAAGRPARGQPQSEYDPFASSLLDG